jgi:hypothetical protein
VTLENPEQASWRVLLERFSQLVSDFIDASRNFILKFLHKKTAKNCENHQRSLKFTVLNFYDLQK